jgi:hypothetical protein
MKRLIGAVMAVALLVSVAPVVAGDSFQALSRLPAGLTPLDDAQLAAVEGGQVDVCIVCLNIAVVTPIEVGVNIAVGVGLGGEVEIEQSVDQSIDAAVFQANN